MPFSKAFIRQTSPVLLASVCWAQSWKPVVAQDNASAQSQSAETQTATDDLATRAVNEKILPLIKEGYGYLSKGSYDKAVKVLKKAISIDQECISARRYLAYALIQKGDAKEALNVMEAVSKLLQPNAFDFYLFAAAYYAAGGVKEAHDCYTEALRQNPGYDAARAGLVKTLAHEHNFEEALSQVQQGLQLTNDDKVKKYYTALGKAVVAAQIAQQQANQAPTVATVPGANSIKSQPVIIK